MGVRDAYLRDGRFDPERMLAFFSENATRAEGDGHPALRIAGEAAWMLSDAPGVERFFEYESRVNDLFSELEVLALCLYDHKLFSPDQLHFVMRTHPLIIHRGAVCRNPYYEPPGEFLSPARTSAQIDRRLDEIRAAQLRADVCDSTETSLQSQRLTAVGRLAGGIAHEFNNILTGVLGLSKIIDEDLPAGSASREDIRQISALGKRAATLTNQLLAFSQKRHFLPRKIELATVFQSAAKDLAPTLGEDIRLSIAVPRSPIFVHADPGAIEQIMIHLAANAREAMPRGGSIDLEMGTTMLTLPDETAREHAFISMTDTGPGISPETQAHIFDPFFSTKADAPSAGMGLSAVYGLVRQNGGTLEVRSAPGCGATFRIHFPLLCEEP